MLLFTSNVKAAEFEDYRLCEHVNVRTVSWEYSPPQGSDTFYAVGVLAGRVAAACADHMHVQGGV